MSDPISNKENVVPMPGQVQWADSFVNLLAGLGVQGRDKFSGQTFTFSQLSVVDLENAYRGDWIARKVVTIPAWDMTREWRSWQADPDQITVLEELEKKLFLQSKMQQALIKSRLYGGAAIVIGVDAGKPEEELILDDVGQDSLQFIHVVSKQQLRSGPIIRDISSKYFGQPEYYEAANEPANKNFEQTPAEGAPKPSKEYSGRQVRLHPSRVVKLIGVDTADQMLSDIWGDSVLQPVSDAIKMCGLVTGSLATLVAELKVDVIKIPELKSILSTAAGTQKMLGRFSAANAAKSVINTIMIDGNEEWQRIQASLAGVPEIIMTYMQAAAGAADIPATRFLGMSPSGLNATGDSDTRNYYDRLAAEQTTVLTPAINLLDEVLIRSALGDRPPEVWYEWRSMWQHTDAEKADIALKKAQTFQIDVNAGLLPTTALANGRANQLIEDGTYPGLEQALDDAAVEGDTIEEHNKPPEIDPAMMEAMGGGVDPKTGLPMPPKQLPPPSPFPAMRADGSYDDFGDYDPNQPRNPDGTWGEGGAGSAKGIKWFERRRDDPYVYHGTTVDRLEGIKKEGMQAFLRTYFASDPKVAMQYGFRSSLHHEERGRGKGGTLLRVLKQDVDPEGHRLRRNEDFWTGPGEIRPEKIEVRVNGKWRKVSDLKDVLDAEMFADDYDVSDYDPNQPRDPLGRWGEAIVVRPEGWQAGSDAVGALNRPDHFYRGMTEVEFNATIGAGRGVESRRDFSITSIEGTSFSSNVEDAESYANYGHSDPRKTGRPNYLVEVRKGENLLAKPDGYFHVHGELPRDQITRVWKMEAMGDAVVAKRLRWGDVRDEFDPNQLRNAKGEWSKGGGGGAKKLTKKEQKIAAMQAEYAAKFGPGTGYQERQAAKIAAYEAKGYHFSNYEGPKEEKKAAWNETYGPGSEARAEAELKSKIGVLSYVPPPPDPHDPLGSRHKGDVIADPETSTKPYFPGGAKSPEGYELPAVRYGGSGGWSYASNPDKAKFGSQEGYKDISGALTDYKDSMKDELHSYGINKALREGGELTAGQQKMVANLDKAFDRLAGPVRDYETGQPKEAALYRGMDARFKNELKVGDVFQDNGYGSTSTSSAFAAGWARKQGIGGTLAKITVPAGHPVLPLADRDPSSERAESEVLLRRGTSYKVTKAGKLLELRVMG